MSKLTRRFKKSKKNRTIKRGGGDDYETERKGIVDMVEDKVSDVASSAATTIADTGLRIAGLERINKPPEDNVVTDNTTGIVSTATNVADKTGAVILDNVNEVLGSDIVKETTEQAAQDTAEIIKETAKQFNDALDKPEVKAQVKESIEKAGEIGEVVVEAAEKPIEKAVVVAASAAQKAVGAALSGMIKVGTDMLGAVPGVGAVVEVGKMVNDGSKAASAVVEASSEAVEAASDAFIEIKQNVQKTLSELNEKKKMSEQISNRTIQSINNFENPIQNVQQTAGAGKTKRRLLKRKAKSKRVRFAI